jgi:hypothetical protein
MSRSRLATGNQETVKVCSYSGNTATICSGGRAVHGTAVAHSLGVAADGFLDQNYFNQIFAEMKAVEGGLINGLGATLKFSTDNAFDIGASGANRPRNLYVAGNGTFGGTVNANTLTGNTINTANGGNWIYWGASTIMRAPTNGNLYLSDQGGTTFGLLQLGGTTSSYPAIKRNGIAINIRLADDSGDAGITAAGGTFSGTVTAPGFSGPLSGNASTASAFATAPGQCSANLYSTGITISGIANCSQVTYGQLGGTIPTWNQNTTGNAATATNVGWTGVTSKPAWTTGNSGTYLGMNQIGCGTSWQQQACDTGSRGYVDHAALADSANSVAWGNVAGRPGISGAWNWAGQGGQPSWLWGSNDGVNMYVYNPSNFKVSQVGGYTPQNVANAYTHDANWTWYDPYVSLPNSTVAWGVFGAEAIQATITYVQCWSDTGSAVLQLRRSDNADFINGGVTCNGSATTNFNGYQVIPAGYYVGMWITSGSAQRVNVNIKYTTAY